MRHHMILFLLSCQVLSASSSMDSLISCLNQASDQQKIEIYQELAVHTIADSFEQSIAYSKQALKYAMQIDDKSKTADILFDMAQNYRERGAYFKSENAYLKSISVFKELNNYRKQAYCYSMLGVIKTKARKFSKAREFFAEAIMVCKRFGIFDILSFSFSYVGNIYYEAREFGIALIYYRRALEVNIIRSHKPGIASNYYSIGSVFNALNSYDDAIEYYLKAMIMEEENQNYEGMAMLYHAMGIIYNDLQNYNAALEYNLLVLRFKEKIIDKNVLVSCYNSIGLSYFKLGKINKSKYYLTEAEKLSTINNYQQGQILTYVNWGRVLEYDNHECSIKYLEKAKILNQYVKDKWLESQILIGIGLIARKNISAKIEILNDGLSIAKEIKTKDLLIDGFYNLSKLYNESGQYRSAYKTILDYSNLKDSIQVKNIHKIADMQLRYETDKRDKTNDILRRENNLQKEIIGKHETQRWLLFACITILSSLMVLGYAKLISKNKFGIKLYRKLSTAMAEHKAQEQSLIHLSALTKLGELAASIIHDLKQPLQDIKLSAEDIESGLSKVDKDSDLIKTLLNDIFEDVDRIAFLADYVINSTNKKVYETVSEFDVNKSIANAYRMIRKQLMRQEFNLSLDLKDHLPKVLGNSWRLEHVLLNILTNSSYALSENRKYQGDGFKDIFTIESYANENNVFIRIKDNGIGVVNSFKSQMFFPFASSKKPGEGSGLGLSIVYNVIRDMNGRLDFNSKPFVGTVITLVFPSAANHVNNHSKERMLFEEVENISFR